MGHQSLGQGAHAHRGWLALNAELQEHDGCFHVKFKKYIKFRKTGFSAYSRKHPKAGMLVGVSNS